MSSRRHQARPTIRRLADWLGLVLVGGSIGCQAVPAPESAAVERLPAPNQARQDDQVQTTTHHEARIPARVLLPPEVEPLPPDGVLTLPAAIAYGLRHNPRLAQAAAQARAARNGESIAFAPFLPEANFNFVIANFNRPILPGGNFVPASLQSGVHTFSLAELGVQWTLLDFGRRLGKYEQAISKVNVEDLFLQRARQTVAFDVATAYFSLLQARAQRKVLVEAVERSTAFRRDAGSQREGGTAEQETLFRSDVQVSRSSEQLAAGQQAVLDADAILNQALGRACPGPLDVVDVARRPHCDDSREVCLNRAARTRPEIGAARQDIAGAAAGIQTAKGERLPLIYARGTIIQADLPGSFNGLIDGAGVNLEQNLFEGGKRIAGVHLAEENARAAAAGLRVVLNNVSAQVNLAFNALSTNRERIRLNAVAVQQARENLRVVLVRFQNGDSIPAQVIEAQTALTGAEVGYYDAVYGFLANLARLDYAQGNDLEPLVHAAMAPPEGDDEAIIAPGDRTPAPDPAPPATGLPPALPAST